MAATTPAAFDPIPRRLGTTANMIVGAAVLEGAVVALASSGTDWTVGPASQDGTYNGAPLGVALYTQAIVGGKVAVAMFGSIVKVCEGAGTQILAGVAVQPALTGANGCVVPLVTTNSGGADGWYIGTMLTKAAANGTGYCLINGPMDMFLGKA